MPFLRVIEVPRAMAKKQTSRSLPEALVPSNLRVSPAFHLEDGLLQSGFPWAALRVAVLSTSVMPLLMLLAVVVVLAVMPRETSQSLSTFTVDGTRGDGNPRDASPTPIQVPVLQPAVRPVVPLSLLSAWRMSTSTLKRETCPMRWPSPHDHCAL